MSVRVLFLGGAGMIGSAVLAEAVTRGLRPTIVTRGDPSRPVPDGVEQLRFDVRDIDALRAAVVTRSFDAVVNWVGFTPADLTGHAELFAANTGQYTFISTASVYARPVPQLPITESSPVAQPRFDYGNGKIACERLLMDAYQQAGLPLTVVRPFHTYDETTVPFPASWTTVERMRAGKPVVVHGDGTSLWTLMHSSDFARAFVPLLGNLHAVGETVNLVSGDILTWDQIYLGLAAAAGVREPVLVHRSSETIASQLPAWGDVLAEDFRHSMIFDIAKLRGLVPGFAPRRSYSAGARAIVAYHDADPARRQIDAELDHAYDVLAARL
jgi:nucleoside-diphosphate-sugar epimerase